MITDITDELCSIVLLSKPIIKQCFVVNSSVLCAYYYIFIVSFCQFVLCDFRMILRMLLKMKQVL